ncbi:hypothetical protein GF325_18900 [Candidatus Bathyarchaeota archaeon]|nr:hypothetical protein [Candidatus Bathyarchaeota archaeon]
MSFPKILPLIFGAVVLLGAILMRDGKNEQTGGLLVLVGSLLMFIIFKDMVYAILSNTNLDLGSEELNFGVFERVIIIGTTVVGATFGLMAGIDGIAGESLVREKLQKIKIVHVTALVNALFTTFAVGWCAIYLFVARHPLESLIFFPAFGFLLAIFFINWYAINRKKHIGMVFVHNIICAGFFGFLTVLNFVWVIVVVLNILSNATLRSMTGPEITFFPRIRKRGHARFPIVSYAVIGGMAFACVLPFMLPWEKIPITQTIPSGNEADIMEINWAYASEMKGNYEWIIQPEILQMMQDINGNTSTTGINISITVPLVRYLWENATLNSTIPQILDTLISAGIVVDLMPIVDATIFGERDEYIHDDNIGEFREIYYEMKEWLNNWSSTYPNVTEYRAMVIDLERTTSIDINELLLNWWGGSDAHITGQNELIDLVGEMRDNGENVAAAFFGFHIFDFADLDDAQQEFFMISIVPPSNWDYIAAMIYQSGEGSFLSTHAYCNNMNYHFGSRGVPYTITTSSDYNDVLTRLKIMKNSGFEKIGAWAMHELFASDNESDPLSYFPGMDAHDPEPWTIENFTQLHMDLGVDEDVTYEFNGYNSENTYEILALLLDMWLIRRSMYSGWPIMGNRLPNNFTLKWAIIITGLGVIAFFTFYIAWKPYYQKKKGKTRSSQSKVTPSTGSNGNPTIET